MGSSGGGPRGGTPVYLRPHGGGALIAGLSGGGKSTFATALVEGMIEGGFQVAFSIPKATMPASAPTVSLGDAKTPPRLSEMTQGARSPGRKRRRQHARGQHRGPAGRFRGGSSGRWPRCCKDRPSALACSSTRRITCFPPNGTSTPRRVPSLPTILVTVDPEAIAVHALERVDDVFAVGTKPAETILAFCKALWIEPPRLPPAPPKKPARRCSGEGQRPAARIRRAARARRQDGAAHPQIRRRRAWRRQEFLFPRPRQRAQPARAEPDDLPADRRRRGRPNLAPSPGKPRRLAMDARGDQGRSACR